MDLGRLVGVAFAAETERRENDQSANDHQHEHRDPEDDDVEACDPAGVGAGTVEGTDVREPQETRHDHDSLENIEGQPITGETTTSDPLVPAPRRSPGR